MGTKTQFGALLSGERVHCFIKAIRAITTHDETATDQIKALEGDIEDVNYCKLGFEYAGTTNCCCWFDHENFDYINNGTTDISALDDVCRNIVSGKCPHVPRDNKTPGRYVSYTNLIHVAVAANNKNIVKLLLLKDPKSIVIRSSTGLCPLHVAIIKSSEKVIRCLYTRKSYFGRRQDENSIFHENKLSIARKLNGKSAEILDYVNDCSAVVDLLKASAIRIENAKMLCKLLEMFETQHLEELMRFLLLNNKQDEALSILKQCGIHTKDLFDPSVIVAAVLADSAKFCKSWINRWYSISADVLGYNLLDIALAVGSKSCAEMLSRSLKPSRASSVVSPYYMVCFIGETDLYEPDIIADLLRRTHAVGHDVNKQFEYKMTALHYIIENTTYMPAVMRTMLNFGADVNARDSNGRTPLIAALTPFDSPLGMRDIERKGFNQFRGLIKDLLYYNPDPRVNGDALYYALKLDSKNCDILRYIYSCAEIRPAHDENRRHFPARSFDHLEFETIRRRTLALSLYTVMLELGFPTSSELRDTFRRMTELWQKDIQVDITEFKPLKSLCRAAFRRAFPGISLHRAMNVLNVPKPLHEYILLDQFLVYFEVDTTHICKSGGKRCCYGDKGVLRVDVPSAKDIRDHRLEVELYRHPPPRREMNCCGYC